MPVCHLRRRKTIGDVLADDVFKTIQDFGTRGISKQHLQSLKGIEDPMSQQENKRIWQLNAALIKLEHDRHIVAGRGFYYALSQ